MGLIRECSWNFQLMWDELPIAGGGGLGGTEPMRKPLEYVNEMLKERVVAMGAPRDAAAVLFPVAFLFVRDNAGNSSDPIAEELKGSHKIWTADLGDFFDLIVPGWTHQKDGTVFDLHRFIDFRDDLESVSRYRYSGDADFLATHFVYMPKAHETHLDLKYSFCLPLTKIVKENHFQSLTGLLVKLISLMPHDGPAEAPTWFEVSDRIFVEKAKKGAWEALKTFCLNFAKAQADEAEVFAITDLSLKR